MTHKDLIIALILQDLKHSQLVMGLDRLGLEASDRHCLELFDIIADLMQVPEGHVELDWSKLYLTYMAECSDIEISNDLNQLKPYAESCFEELERILQQ